MRWGLVTDVAKQAGVPVAEADEVDVEAVVWIWNLIFLQKAPAKYTRWRKLLYS